MLKRDTVTVSVERYFTSTMVLVLLYVFYSTGIKVFLYKISGEQPL